MRTNSLETVSFNTSEQGKNSREKGSKKKINQKPQDRRVLGWELVLSN